jgi:exopolysaccharide production protein ExoQ
VEEAGVRNARADLARKPIAAYAHEIIFRIVCDSVKPMAYPIRWRDYMLLNLRVFPQAVCLALIVVVGTDLPAIALGEGAELARRVVFAGHVAILAMALAFHQAALGAARSAPILVALILVVCASALWSIDHGATIRRLLPFVSCTILGMLIGHALSLRGLVLFFGVLGVMLAVTSLLAIGIFPAARGAPPWDDTWRGAFNHKNALGGACAVLLPFVLYSAWIARPAHRVSFVVGAVILLVLLLVSESRTAQLIGSLALLGLGLGFLLRHALLTWATLLVSLLLALIALVPFLIASGLAGTFFEAIGRQPTISGRVPIWQLVWPWIEERPILGFGYAAFWEPDSRRVFQIANDPTIQYIPFYSHNGLIETLLNVGLLGLTLLIALLVQAAGAIFRLLARRPYTPDLVPLLIFLLSFCLVNISEASALQRDDLVWIMLAAVLVRLLSLSQALSRAPSLPPAIASRPSRLGSMT